MPRRRVWTTSLLENGHFVLQTECIASTTSAMNRRRAMESSDPPSVAKKTPLEHSRGDTPMSEADRHAQGRRPNSLEHRIDSACDRFESAWRAGARPQIEAALVEFDPSDRSALFRELLALEIELRRRSGESPSPQDYHVRFSDQVSLVDAVLSESPQHKRTVAGRSALAKSGTSRNLLLGLLGLQNNFITREEFLTAFNAWVVKESGPLGLLLLERGALDASRLGSVGGARHRTPEAPPGADRSTASGAETGLNVLGVRQGVRSSR
jgi:hypothetical protein